MKSNHNEITVGFIFILLACLGELLLFGSSTLWGLIMISIICTAGAGGLIWILIAAIIGTIILSLTKLTISLTNSEKRDYYTTESNIALSRYILDSRQYGLSEMEIFDRLIDAGWPENKIRKVLK